MKGLSQRDDDAQAGDSSSRTTASAVTTCDTHEDVGISVHKNLTKVHS